MRHERSIHSYLCVLALSLHACSSESAPVAAPAPVTPPTTATAPTPVAPAAPVATPQIVQPPTTPTIQPPNAVPAAGAGAATGIQPPTVTTPVAQAAGAAAPVVPTATAGTGAVPMTGVEPVEGVSTAKACVGKAGKKRGKSNESVMAPSRRTFVYYAPKDLDPNKPVPLVIVPHGYTQSGQAMFDITRYSDLADREKFVVMFPDGAPGSIGPWDVGSGVCGNGQLVPGSGDDQKFLDEMVKFAEADQCIDHEHKFLTGWSMGGYLINHTGCLRDDFRALGPHSAGTYQQANCKGKPKPVIMFHFNPDGLIDFNCGVKARDQWIKRNGCSADNPDTTMVKGGNCKYYKGCKEGAQVAFCQFDIPSNHLSDFLAGHAWSGGTKHSYSIAETESATELGWAFFKKYAW